MPDCHHVTGLSAHEVTGSAPVIEGEVLLKEIAVYAVSHVIEHILRSCLEQIQKDKSKDSSYNSDTDHKKQEFWKKLCSDILAIAYDVINDEASDPWIDDCKNRCCCNQDKSKCDFPGVLFEVGIEPPHCRLMFFDFHNVPSGSLKLL